MEMMSKTEFMDNLIQEFKNQGFNYENFIFSNYGQCVVKAISKTKGIEVPNEKE